MSESCCRPTAKPRLTSAKQALLTAMREIKAGASTAGKPAATAAACSHSQFRLQLRPHLLLNPICSVPIGEATGGVIRESSASSPSNFASTKPRLRSGAIFPTPAPVDAWSKPRNPVKPGSKVEIGLWVPNGKIWVKGFRAERSGHPQRARPTEFAFTSKAWHRPSATICASSSSSCRTRPGDPKPKTATCNF